MRWVVGDAAQAPQDWRPDMAAELRPDRVPVRIAGKDASRLLNDVLTGHFAAEDGPAQWWALLSPQGKIQAEGLAGWAKGSFWFDVDKDAADAFLKRMRLYRLRAEVELEPLGETHVVGWSAGPDAAAVSHSDPRAGGLGWRVIADREAAAAWSTGMGHAALRIGAGVMQLGPDFAPDTTFPHDIAMDALGGIDFEKGCYVGQEVVSRMKHRGTARRRPVLVEGPGLVSGAAVMAGEREAGTLGAVAGERSVASLRLDRITDLDAVQVGGQAVKLALPPWASYRFAESGGAD